MWSGAKHKDEIWQLLKFVSSPEGSSIPHKGGQYSSPCPSVWIENGDDKDPVMGWFLKQFNLARITPEFTKTPYFWKCVGPDFMGIWTRYIEQNERPLETVVKDAAAKIQACLDSEYAQEG
jgi:hypothetical protein